MLLKSENIFLKHVFHEKYRSILSVLLLSSSAIPKTYQHILSLVFAVKEINENPKILPNVSLGFHIHDSYLNARMTHQNTLKLLSSWQQIVPNFKCNNQNNLIAVIGGRNSDTSLHLATILGIYKIPQVGYSVNHVQLGCNIMQSVCISQQMFEIICVENKFYFVFCLGCLFNISSSYRC